jgi:hypothetical protein
VSDQWTEAANVAKLIAAQPWQEVVGPPVKKKIGGFYIPTKHVFATWPHDEIPQAHSIYVKREDNEYRATGIYGTDGKVYHAAEYMQSVEAREGVRARTLVPRPQQYKSPLMQGDLDVSALPDAIAKAKQELTDRNAPAALVTALDYAENHREVFTLYTAATMSGGMKKSGRLATVLAWVLAVVVFFVIAPGNGILSSALAGAAAYYAAMTFHTARIALSLLADSPPARRTIAGVVRGVYDKMPYAAPENFAGTMRRVRSMMLRAFAMPAVTFVIVAIASVATSGRWAPVDVATRLHVTNVIGDPAVAIMAASAAEVLAVVAAAWMICAVVGVAVLHDLLSD